MNIRFLEKRSELIINLFVEVDDQFRLRTFIFKITSGKDLIDIKGELQNGEAIVSMLVHGKSNVYRILMKEPPILASTVVPYLVKKGFSEGSRESISVPIFDPSTLNSFDGIEIMQFLTNIQDAR